MSVLLLWVATLAGALLIAAGIAGKHPRPSDGQWQALSPSVRAGLTVVGLMVILAGWALNQGWFQTPKAASSAAPLARYSDARGDRPIDTLWNEAEVAERQARQHPRPVSSASSQPSSAPASDPLPTPTPALESLPAPAAVAGPAAVAASAPTAVTAAVPAPVAAAATPAVAMPVSTPPSAPEKVAAAAADAPICNCDPSPAKPPVKAKTASRPLSSGSRQPRVSRGDGVSVCALQRQHSIGAEYANESVPVGTSRRDSGASIRVQDRLGPQQLREQLRISIDGGSSGTLSLGSAASSGSVNLRVPADGARYRLSGYTEYADGRRVPLSGEGFLDSGAQRYELRLADDGGRVFLEPAS